jgi:zinc finger protein
VEGIIMRAVDELQALQDERKVNYGTLGLVFLVFSFCSMNYAWVVMRYHILQKVDPEKAEAIAQFLLKLSSLGLGEAAFTFILDDPAGNSFVENP